MDISTLSVGELQKLAARIEKEIEIRNKKKRGQAMEEIKTIVAKYGLKLGEVIGQSVVRKPRVGRKEIADKPHKTQAVILYRHPENPSLTWTGGRGRPPKWIKDWESSGHGRNEALVK